MKSSILIVIFLFCAICIWAPVLSFFTEAELESYNVLVKPYGLDLTKLISKISPNVWTCIKSHGELQTCNMTSLSVSSNISSGEIRNMFEKCPTGQLGCFQSQTNSSLQGALNRLLKVVRRMCGDQCWKKLAFVTRTCILKNATGVKTAEQYALQLISEVLDATCLQIQGLTCAEKMIKRILDNEHVGDPAHKVCNVSGSLKAETKKCTSACYEELQQFYKNLGCCVGSLRDTIECYNISTKQDSFGAFVMNSYALCHLSPPTACNGTQCQQDWVPTTSSHV